MNPYIIPGLKGINIPEKYFIMSYQIKSERVVELVCETYDVTTEQLRHKRRERNIVEARHVLSWVLVKKMGMTLSEVGKTFLGGRDHTTIINSLQRFSNLYDTEPDFRDKVATLVHKIYICNENNTSSEQ